MYMMKLLYSECIFLMTVAPARKTIPNFDTYHEILPQHANCLRVFSAR